MRLRKNRRTETAALNAARTFFERHDCVFQPVELANDYGKDAYIDLTHGDRVTGTCVAAQIKGGSSYKRADGYAIPVGEHFDVWRNSSLPIAGIVHDPSDGLLRWCSITAHLESLRGEQPASIPVHSDDILTTETLATRFRPHFEREALRTAAGNCILDVCSESEERQFMAISECLAHGRSDPRVLISLRYLLNALSGAALDRAIIVLTHVTPHPDIFWTEKNWIPQEVCGVVCKHFRWSTAEILKLLGAVHPEAWYRGQMGEHLYMMLLEDPEIASKIEDALAVALRAGNEDTAWSAFYLAIYWARRNARQKLDDLVMRHPDLQSLTMFKQLAKLVAEHGGVTLFE